MKGMFAKLAWTGMKQNKRLFVPYILSCVGMVVMFYIIHSLSFSPLLREMRGGSSIESILSLGKFVVAAFALLFLLYTNAFLIRRRSREFGLYNILGVDKRGIGRIIFWESLFVALIGLAGGLAFGILFSKLAELGLLRAIGGGVDFSFTVVPEAVGFTAEIFSLIFLLLMGQSLWQVRRLKPLEMLKNENMGEKPPKANGLLALAGAVLVGAAYYEAVTIVSPLKAIFVFFIAVLMVIAGTYLLFMSGSVVLCRLLQRSRRYYYQKKHFISVSSMAFRMKRNGAGLASICILSTMVLVMLASTASLYFGREDALRSRYVREYELTFYAENPDVPDEPTRQAINDTVDRALNQSGIAAQNVYQYRAASVSGIMDGDNELQIEVPENGMNVDYDAMRTLFFISQEDYHRLTGKSIALQKGEAMVYPLRCSFSGDAIKVKDTVFRVTGQLDEMFTIGQASMLASSSLILVIPDYSDLHALGQYTFGEGEDETPMLEVSYYYGFDTDAPDETVCEVIADAAKETVAGTKLYAYSTDSIYANRSDFMVTFGGLFFIGIILSLVFIFATVMIIYYKQVSEGYEDRARFSIMRKVGMTKGDIQKSVNSQILTVFYAPLLMAGLHLAFAFPLVWKMLQLFNLHNVGIVIVTTLIAFAGFAVCYALIYAVTAKGYYAIVSTDEAN